jgi:hypothetical protein
MTPIDYLLLAGALLAGGYVVARLFIGWLRSSANHPRGERDRQLTPPLVPEREFERARKTGAPWHVRK